MIRALPAPLHALLLASFVATLASPAPPPAGAQTPSEAAEPGALDPFELPDIVVTGTRVPVRSETLPSPVTVLTGSALRSQGIRTVADALRLVPGAQVVRAGAAGGQTSLFMRGGESDFVKVLIDGVAVNDAGGAIDLADLTTDQIERIEVARGPVSVLYGSDAASGVVQIFTLRGRGAPRFDATVLGGRGERRHGEGGYPLLEGEASLSGGSRALSWSVGGGRSWTEGTYPLNNERTLQTANAHLGWSPDGNTRVSVSSRLSASESGFPTDGAGALVDENAVLDRRLWSVGAEASHALGSRVEVQVHLGRSDRHQLATDEPDGPADTLGVFASTLESTVTRTSAELRLDADLGPGRTTFGLVGERLGGSVHYDSEAEWGPLSAKADYARTNRAAYLQVLLQPVPSTHLTLGGRVDDNDAFGRFDTYRAGVSSGVGEGTRLRGSVGRAFREPSFSESYGSGFGDLGNRELVPERTRSWEVGVDQDVGPLRLGATWFDQVFHDLIQFTFATEDPADPNYVNVGAAASVGLELTGEASFGRLGFSGSFTHLRTRVLDPGLATDETFVEGEALLRRPARSGGLAARLGFDEGSLAVTLTVVGARTDLDFGEGFPAPRVTLPRYTTVDLAAERSVPIGSGRDLRLLVRVENLADADYEGIRGFPAPGRILRVGARFGLGG